MWNSANLLWYNHELTRDNLCSTKQKSYYKLIKKIENIFCISTRHQVVGGGGGPKVILRKGDKYNDPCFP